MVARIGFYLAWMIFFASLPDRPENYFVLAGFILVFGIYFAFVRLKNNKEYSGESYLRLRHEDDNLEIVMSFTLGGILIIGSVWYVLTAGQFAAGTLVCSLLALFLIFNGLTYQKSIVLKKEASKIIKVDDPEIQFEPGDVDKLAIHLNKIVAGKTAQDQSVIIQFLRLKNEEIEEIKKWFLEKAVPQEV